MSETERVPGPSRFVERAGVLIELRKYGHAVREARRALRAAPDDPEAHRLLAVALWRQNKLAQARAPAETAVGLAPQDAYAHNTLAGILYANGDRRGAREHLEQAVTLEPGVARFHTRYARFLLGVYRTSRSPRQDWKRARQEIEESLRQDPRDAGAHLIRARLLHREERFAEAEASAREALRLAPTLARAHEELGDIYFAWLRGPDAFQCFREALRLNPTDRGLKLKTIRALENRLPVLGKVWKFARHRSRTSSLLWLLYLLIALGGGLVSGFLGAREVAAVFLFALVAPMIVMIVLFLILIGIDLAFTLGVINGWIRI